MSLNEAHNLQLSMSAISTTPTSLFENINSLIANGVHRIHIDVMDGNFVPRIGLYPEFVAELRRMVSIPIDIHLMTYNPFQFLNEFVQAGATRITPHIESTVQIHRLVSSIKSLGVEVGLALNPGTPISFLEEVISELDSVTLMAINPGIVGHKFIPKTINKLEKFKLLRLDSGYHGDLELDGGVVFDNVKLLAQSGCNILVCGAGTIFKSGSSPTRNLELLTGMFE